MVDEQDGKIEPLLEGDPDDESARNAILNMLLAFFKADMVVLLKVDNAITDMMIGSHLGPDHSPQCAFNALTMSAKKLADDWLGGVEKANRALVANLAEKGE